MNSTLRNVSAFSKILGFDSFVMLNLYPQRSTDPSNIHKRKSKLAHEANLEVILEVLLIRYYLGSMGKSFDSRSF